MRCLAHILSKQGILSQGLVGNDLGNDFRNENGVLFWEPCCETERDCSKQQKKIQVSLFVSVASRLLLDVCERQVTKIYSALRCTDQ